MRPLIREIHYGIRMLLTKPGFTVVAVLTLALGIGANTAIFSVVDAVLLRSLPYPEADRLVRVFGTVEARGDDRSSASLPDFYDWIDQNRSFKEMAGLVRWNYNLIGADRPERVWGGMSTARIFEVMGVEPILGRTFQPEEDRPGGEKVVVISYGLWQRLFVGAPDVLGKTLRIDDNEHRIIGVMPQGFEYPDEAELWTPLALGPSSYPRSLHFLRVVARLERGVGLASAQAEMTGIARRLDEQYPDTNEGRGIVLVPLLEDVVGKVRPALLMLLGAAGLVLLIACGNIANLLMSRITERLGEITLRQALGASKGRLTVQFLIEGLILAVAGSVVGLLMARGLVDALTALSPREIPRLESVSIDGRILAFTALTALLTAFVFSFIPVLQLSKRNLGQSLREGDKGSVAGSGTRRWRALLVVAEVALALCLLIGAGLLIRSFTSILRVDPGFRADHVLTMEIALPWSKYTQTHQTANFYGELLERIRALPGVRSAGAVWRLPLSELTGSTEFEIEGRPDGGPEQKTAAAVQAVSADYFASLGIPLLSGRTVTARDDAEAPPVVVINEAMARRFWPDEDPVGEKVTFDVDFGPVGKFESQTREIVGVVADFKNTSLTAPATPEMFFPFRQSTWRMMSITVRTANDPRNLAEALREQVWAIDADQPVSQMRTLQEILSESVAQAKFNMLLLGLFAAIALALATVGIFSVISYSVSQRTSEIGLRMALGARHRDVVRQIVTEGLTLTGLGLLLGLAGTFLITRTISGLLYGITATDPSTFVAVPLGALVVAFLASWLPARRAARVDPMVALRCE